MHTHTQLVRVPWNSWGVGKELEGDLSILCPCVAISGWSIQINRHLERVKRHWTLASQERHGGEWKGGLSFTLEPSTGRERIWLKDSIPQNILSLTQFLSFLCSQSARKRWAEPPFLLEVTTLWNDLQLLCWQMEHTLVFVSAKKVTCISPQDQYSELCCPAYSAHVRLIFLGERQECCFNFS